VWDPHFWQGSSLGLSWNVWLRLKCHLAWLQRKGRSKHLQARTWRSLRFEAWNLWRASQSLCDGRSRWDALQRFQASNLRDLQVLAWRCLDRPFLCNHAKWHFSLNQTFHERPKEDPCQKWGSHTRRYQLILYCCRERRLEVRCPSWSLLQPGY
jgi:hypothetical protein